MGPLKQMILAIVICKTCNGIKCIMCNSTGLERMPWDLCDNCYGDGEVELKPK